MKTEELFAKMNKTAKILCAIFAVIITAGLSYAIITYHPDYKTASDAFNVKALRVNYSDEPSAVSSDELTFGWQMDSDKVGISQTAYRIVVNDKSNFKGRTYWDSGKILSAESACVQYSGRKLDPEKEYYWKVTVWDDKDEYSTSETPAHFETACDEKALSKALFISEGSNASKYKEYSLEFDAAITSQALGTLIDVKNGSNYYLWQFNLSDHGVLYLRKHVFYPGGYTVDEVDISKKCGSEIEYGDEFHVKITSDRKSIKTYVNSKLVDTYSANLYNSAFYGFRQGAGEAGWVDNIETKIVQDNGEKIEFAYDFDDEYNPYSIGSVISGRLELGPFPGEQKSYISFDGSKVINNKPGGVMFRKSFELSGKTDVSKLKKARLYVTALGNFNIYINGNKIGDDVLKPGWTDYSTRVQYFTYDVSEALKSGENVICAYVTSGWWNGRVSFSTYGNLDNAFMCRLVTEYKNGRKSELVTDESWEWNREDCPVVEASIYDGETYDARYSPTVYMPDEYDPERWNYAAAFLYEGEVTPASGAPVKVRNELELTPSSVKIHKETEDNGSDFGKVIVLREFSGEDEFTLEHGETAVVDLGQNMVGWPLISVSGRSGTQIIMRFGEMLNDSGSKSRGNDGPEGSVYTSNYRSAASTNRYIMSGEGVENYHTEYSFYGFRYISITVSDTVTFHSVRGQVVGSVNTKSGSITTSDASVNQLISNIIWSMRGNYLSVPTDCPQRDERLGWTGDTQVFVGTGSYNANVAPFFRKWLTDCIDSQMSDGSYPDVIPRSNATGSGAAAWGDAGIIVPYTMYKKYGDIFVIRRNYDSMEKYMSFVIKNGGPLERYGDWLAYQETEQRLICKAYYAYDALLMEQMSDALGYTQRKDYYRDIYENVKSEYIESYFDEIGLIPGSQTAAVLTLLADLVPNEDMRYSVLTMLRNNIKKNGWKLQTGFVGTANIVNVLSLLGDDETAYTLLLQRDNPSWLYSIDQGATTTWERWDSYTLSRGFGDVGMNSFNHYAYGCVGEWMYTYMAGINGSGTTGFKQFELSPRIDPKLRITSCEAEYDSVYGTIYSSWNVDGSGSLSYDFSVPANTSCKVVLPLKIGEKDVSSISIGNISLNISELSGGDHLAEGLSFTEIQNGCIILKAVSGNFSIRLS